MIKKMFCLGSAIFGVIGLSACGSTTSPPIDTSVLSTCDNNAISTGGYWWTYTDHNDPTATTNKPYHATISQVTSAAQALQVTPDNSSYGNVCEVKGDVPPALPWADVSAVPQAAYTIDPHWASVYPDATIPDYPSAGLGFGYQHYNKPYDATQGGKYIGIVFDMKTTADNMPAVWISMPMVGTDLPDPSPGITDDFPAPTDPNGHGCKYYTLTNTPGTGGMSCFTNYRKGIEATTQGGGPYNTLATVNTWHHYCVLFSEVAPPNWANTASLGMIPKFDPTQALKVQWDFFQPPEVGKGGVDTQYGIAVDNVKLITVAEAQTASNNCDPARITAPFGTGDAG